MKSYTIYLFMALIVLALTGCPNPPCFNPNPTYSFAVTAHFTPERDSIRVGDTLYLVSEFPSTMVPVGGREAVVYTNSEGIGNILSVSELAPNTKIATDAVFSFDYFAVLGSIYNDRSIPRPDGVQQLRYAENTENYILKIGIIPKKKGIFSLVIGDGISNGRTTGHKCTKAAFPTTLSNQNPHIYYLEKFINEPNVEIPNIHYLFKVY